MFILLKVVPSRLSKNLGVAEYKYSERSFRSLEPVVGAIHEVPLPQVSYLNSATPKSNPFDY